ncbi:rerric reductase like transmembrane component [Aspergillus coremiiformis]|uniref:Rerric reductase like transmembrane component n=1 Tax=Aspergillus coremiiformis TaxID=138285 RepID=A0A5N6Z310_9EURO|nr:rerric reductase like transmembrane component [Aspergillus coremiiformis]
MSVLPWPWHFVSVSPTEQQHRRELLDLRGYYAQISFLLVVLFIRFYTRYFRAAEPSNDSRARRKQRSWWDQPPFANWIETRRQYTVCIIWLGWLLSLSVWNSGNDYLHLTKALGHVALSQLPFQVLMSPAFYLVSNPSSPSTMSLLTSISQPALTPYHRLFGRVVLSPLLAGHAALYLNFFAQSSHPDFGSLLAKRVQDLDVQWGLGGLTLAIMILLFGRPLRTTSWVQLWPTSSIKGRRQVFYYVHVLLVMLLCIAAYGHVSQAQIFMHEALGASVINMICCWKLS